MVDLKHRSSEIEIMDDFSQSGEVIDTTLHELERINSLLGGNDVSISGLKELLQSKGKRSLKIADLGCGGGDLMMCLSKWGVKNDLDLHFLGVDANPSIVKYARNNTSDFENIEYEELNIFSSEFRALKFDVVHCSLFTHHFTHEELVAFFKQLMIQVEVGIVINDLHRHTVSYYFTKWIIRTLSKSEMVRYDSVVSVARSFKRKELISILEEAGISKFSLKWKWAFRWQLVIYK